MKNILQECFKFNHNLHIEIFSMMFELVLFIIKINFMEHLQSVLIKYYFEFNSYQEIFFE
jgi:hypothetical protein